MKHEFKAVGTFLVTLTVTDDRGQSASVSKNVTVAATATPDAAFVFSPSAPVEGDKVFFNGATSTAAVGRTIVQYDWDFGTGVQAPACWCGTSIAKAGAYTVVLTVTDDAGNRASTSKAVTSSCQPRSATRGVRAARSGISYRRRPRRTPSPFRTAVRRSMMAAWQTTLASRR